MKRSFTTNEFYHLFNRGVDKRKVFLDKNDNIRFIHDLYEFNDTKPAKEFYRLYSKRRVVKKSKNVGSRVSHIRQREKSELKSEKSELKNGLEGGLRDGLGAKRVQQFSIDIANGVTEKDINKRITKDRIDLLVNLHAFVLMPNHHHLLVEQIIDGGVSLFMRKIHTGYTKAFNLRYKRDGHLFQSPFKDVHIKDDIRLGFLICYLHSNPLSLWMPSWRNKKLTNSEIKKALKFLEKYRWSSHSDYLGIKNFPSLISKEFLLEFFDGTEGYREFFINWLEQYKKNVDYIKELIID